MGYLLTISHRLLLALLIIDATLGEMTVHQRRNKFYKMTRGKGVGIPTRRPKSRWGQEEEYLLPGNSLCRIYPLSLKNVLYARRKITDGMKTLALRLLAAHKKHISSPLA